MEFLQTLNSWAHTSTATLALMIGAYVIFNTKGGRTHKKMGILYFYLMAINYTKYLSFKRFCIAIHPSSSRIRILVSTTQDSTPFISHSFLKFQRFFIPFYFATILSRIKDFSGLHFCQFLLKLFLGHVICECNFHWRVVYVQIYRNNT